MKIMASSPITSWQIDEETMETATLYFLGLQNHCTWWLQPWIERRLLLGRKAMTNLGSVLKSRDITLPAKVCIVKAMVFPVVMYRCESWTIKKTECLRSDAFESWCCRRLLRSPWTAKRSFQSILKEINPEYSLEELMLKLKLQYFSHLMRRANSFEKTLMVGKTEGGEDEMVGWHHSSMDMSLSKLWEIVKDGKPGVLQSMGLQRVRHDWGTEPNWEDSWESLGQQGDQASKSSGPNWGFLDAGI